MSVLIKGMRMPENCTRCDSIGLNVAIGCPVMSGTNERATDCPLVDLGKHGRLIDGDEFVRIWQGAKIYGDIKPLVDVRPTVIEAEDGT